jgi:multidrug efflux pump subunit AcrB
MQATNAQQTGESATMIVLDAIADELGVDVADLDQPLYTAIDPEALDRLLEHGRDVAITFEYQDQTVVVSGDGEVSVAAAANGGTPS